MGDTIINIHFTFLLVLVLIPDEQAGKFTIRVNLTLMSHLFKYIDTLVIGEHLEFPPSITIDLNYLMEHRTLD